MKFHHPCQLDYIRETKCVNDTLLTSDYYLSGAYANNIYPFKNLLGCLYILIIVVIISKLIQYSGCICLHA